MKWSFFLWEYFFEETKTKREKKTHPVKFYELLNRNQKKKEKERKYKFYTENNKLTQLVLFIAESIRNEPLDWIHPNISKASERPEERSTKRSSSCLLLLRWSGERTSSVTMNENIGRLLFFASTVGLFFFLFWFWALEKFPPLLPLVIDCSSVVVIAVVKTKYFVGEMCAVVVCDAF